MIDRNGASYKEKMKLGDIKAYCIKVKHNKLRFKKRKSDLVIY